MLTEQLIHLGFSLTQSKTATSFLCQPSPFALALLNSASHLEAAIEYLILHLPECDLPQRFLPSTNSSNPFITSVHLGTDDLKRRWVEDKAVKEAGWPAHAVKTCTANPELLENWDLLTMALTKWLVGEDNNERSGSVTDDSIPFELDLDELEALGISFSEPEQLLMPLFSAPILVHILRSSDKRYPRPGFSPMYMTSASVPPYIRLHLLSRISVALKSGDFIEPGEGFCMAVMRFFEGEWAKIEDHGPPDMSTVLQHFVPNSQVLPIDEDTSQTSKPFKGRKGQRRNQSVRDARDNHQIREDFQAICRTEKVSDHLSLSYKIQ